MANITTLTHWPRLRSLLDRALDLEGEERRQYVNSLELADRELHAHMIRLLNEYELAGDDDKLSNAMSLISSLLEGDE